MKKFIFQNEGKKYYYSDLSNALNNLGIKKRDIIFVHSDLKSFGRINTDISRDEFLGAFNRALTRSVGSGGNVLMPTFSYSFCKKENFDPRTTPSTVGVLTEYFRKLKGVRRSIDPIFSISAYGPDKDFFTDVETDCFGSDSVFEKLYNANVKIVFLGNTFDITYMHFVEQRFTVPYRYFKKFRGKIRIGDKLLDYVFNYNVVYKKRGIEYDLEQIAEYLRNCGALKVVELGHSRIRAASAVDIFNLLTKGLKKDIYFLTNKKCTN